MAKPIPESEAIEVMVAAGLEPLVPYIDSNSKWKCRCIKCRREVFPTYARVKKGYRGCLFCAGKKIDLDELNSKVDNLNLTSLHPYLGANKNWRMKCRKCGEEFNSRLDYINKGRGCPFCSGARISEKDAVQMMKDVGLVPLVEFKSSATPWECSCTTCGKVSKRTLHNVRNTGKGCPHCSFAANRSPKEAMDKLARNLGFEPLEPYQTSDTLWRLKCTKCGQETSRFPASLKYRKRSSNTGLSGCLGCVTRQKVSLSDQGETAINIMQKAGFEVLEPYVSAKHPWKVRCKKCQMEMTKQFTHVKSENKGCKYCSGNYLNQEQINTIMLNAQLEPLEPYVNAQKPWKCKCLKCGRTVKPRFGGISAGIGGCKFCGPHGLDFNKPAFVYLITNEELSAHKIGVSGLDIQTDRLKEHTKFGWKLYKRLDVDSGEVAYLIEQGVLLWIRKEIQLPIYVLREQMPQGGFSETFDGTEIDLPVVWAKVREISKGVSIEL